MIFFLINNRNIFESFYLNVVKFKVNVPVFLWGLLKNKKNTTTY